VLLAELAWMLRTMKKLPSKLLKGPLSLTSFLFLLFLSTTRRITLPKGPFFASGLAHLGSQL
jgi:hypothetical protein